MRLDDLRERNYQSIIKEYLINTSSYICGKNLDYDRFYAIDTKMLFDFLESTQPKAMEKLESIYKLAYKENIIKRIDSEIFKRGILDVLKNGVKDRGQTLTLMYKKPATTANFKEMELYNKNKFSVTEELVYAEEGRIDLVIFLNGIPIITFELKNNISGQTVTDARIQYMDDRNPKDKLFKFNERCIVHFAMDTEEVFMTTKLDKRNTYFLPFNKGDNGSKGNTFVEDKFKVHYMWEDILNKDTLLYLIDKFVYFSIKEEVDEDSKKKKVKKTIIFPRYHQIDVVRKVLADVIEHKTEKNYLIQHSAGSGKTNSISWLAHRLMSLHDSDNKVIFDAVIVMTDRTVVDKQLQKAVKSLEHKKGSIKIIKKDSNQLADSLNDGTKIIVSTIQKFRFILDKLELLKEKRFAIIIDEAHSSTSGKNMEAVTTALTTEVARKLDDEISDRDLEDEIIEEIKRNGKQNNISMFAFTATPKPATLDMFGKAVVGSTEKVPFHLYSMKQAIEEGFILDVLKNYVTYKTYYKVTQTVADDPEISKSKTKRQIAKYRDIHPTNISQKVEIIVEHFKANVMHKIGGKAKAMVVTSSREAAVKYKLAFEKYIEKNSYAGIKALVAFTGKVYIEELDKEVTEPSLNGFSEDKLPKKFDTDEYQVLLVADKYQTGFDQPLLHTMYIDKKLKGVKAVQTLSRLNRTYQGKDDTFILDFKNEIEDIKDSFATFYECTELTDTLDPNLVYDLERKIEDFEIIDRMDIDKFIKKAYKETKTSKDRTQQTTYVMKAVDRCKRYSKEDILEIRAVLKKFVNFYGLMIQLSEFEDVELHKLYIFTKFLVKAINVESDRDIDITDKVSIENFRQVKDKEIKQTEIVAEGQVSYNSSISTNKIEEQFDALSHIIKEINEVFGMGFGENEKLATLQIEEILKTSSDLERRAKNNSIDDFKYSFKKEYENSIIEGLEKNQNFFEKLLCNEAISNKLMEVMIERVYNSFKGK